MASLVGRSLILCMNHPVAEADALCQGGDSNPYGFLHQILSLARLPIPPPRQIAMLTNLAVLAAAGKLRLSACLGSCDKSRDACARARPTRFPSDHYWHPATRPPYRTRGRLRFR